MHWCDSVIREHVWFQGDRVWETDRWDEHTPPRKQRERGSQFVNYAESAVRNKKIRVWSVSSLGDVVNKHSFIHL